jgi:uncharacterized membrane protein (UPF0127 family)
MRQVQILNRSKPLQTPLIADYADSFASKLRGLAWRRSLPADRAMILAEKAASRLGAGIHMLGMFFDLTIVWLDDEMTVVDVARARRWRSFVFPRRPARFVIECTTSRHEDFRIGDQLHFEDTPSN